MPLQLPISYYFSGPNAEISAFSEYSFHFYKYSPTLSVLVQPTVLPDITDLSKIYIFMKMVGNFDKNVTVYAFSLYQVQNRIDLLIDDPLTPVVDAKKSIHDAYYEPLDAFYYHSMNLLVTNNYCPKLNSTKLNFYTPIHNSIIWECAL